MKKTKVAEIIPFTKGMDTASVPGMQDLKAFSKMENVLLRNRGSARKRPGIERLPYIGNDEGYLQNAIHFFATTGFSQKGELIRVLNGEVESVLNDTFESLGLSVHPQDAVSFDRFGNALLMFFENTIPYYYLIGGTMTPLQIPASHVLSPPCFSTVHHNRLWYAGRKKNPHVLTVSAVDDFNSYTLDSGGFAMTVNDGDGDPVGITGISRPFRGDIYCFKYNSIYRIPLSDYGYGTQEVTGAVGCVCHNTIINTQNDILFVSPYGIHSLVNTDKYGAIEESTLTYPVYEWFQEEINWAMAKYMKATYNQDNNCYLLSYPSAGSAFPDKILGLNVTSREMFGPWNIECGALGKYFDSLKMRTLVGVQNKGLGYLNNNINTSFGEAINVSMKTGIQIPVGANSSVNFVRGWLIGKPTVKSTKIEVKYWVDGLYVGSKEVNTYGGGEGAMIGNASPIGESEIGYNKEKIISMEFDISAIGATIEFGMDQIPGAENLDQSCELYGILYEIEYNEDTGVTTAS